MSLLDSWLSEPLLLGNAPGYSNSIQEASARGANPLLAALMVGVLSRDMLVQLTWLGCACGKILITYYSDSMAMPETAAETEYVRNYIRFNLSKTLARCWL